MILVIDNFDSFTYNLVDYLEQLGQEVAVLRNDTSPDLLLSTDYTQVVLSPGPGIPKKAGLLMKAIDFYAERVPVLGICLGHQAIAEYFQGTLKKAIRPMHGKISEVVNHADPIFLNIPKKIKVTRYHSLVCDQLPVELEVISESNAGEIMALKHKKLPIYGLQYHPEAVLTQYGLEILRNWINLNPTSD